MTPKIICLDPCISRRVQKEKLVQIIQNSTLQALIFAILNETKSVILAVESQKSCAKTMTGFLLDIHYISLNNGVQI